MDGDSVRTEDQRPGRLQWRRRAYKERKQATIPRQDIPPTPARPRGFMERIVYKSSAAPDPQYC
jgi:hypothetical protein